MRFRRRSKEDVVDVKPPSDDEFSGSVRILRPTSDGDAATRPVGELADAADTSATEQIGAQRDPEAATTPGSRLTINADETEVGDVVVSAPGGDPLLKPPTAPSLDDASDQDSQDQHRGHSGVRIIPAQPADDAGLYLDPTAPFAGPDGGSGQGPADAPGENAWADNGVDDGSGDGVSTTSIAGRDDDSTHRPTIVINDDGASTVAAEGSATRPRIDPKFRARRRAVRRSMGRRRMVLLGLGVIVVLTGVVVGALLGSPLFALRLSNVEVTGWQYADQGQMYAIFDELAGTPVLRIDEEAVEARFEEVPWVEKAVVTTRLPNSATIQIRERVPLATFQGADGRFRIIDRSGRVLEIVDGMPIEYMWVTVADPPNLELGEFAATGITAAAEATRSFTPTIRPRVRRIAVDQSGSSMALYLRDGTRVNLGAAKDIFSKLVRLQTLLIDFPGMTNVRIDVSTAETTRSSANMLQLTDGASDPPPEEPSNDVATSDSTGASDSTGTPDSSGTSDPSGDTATDATANANDGEPENPEITPPTEPSAGTATDGN